MTISRWPLRKPLIAAILSSSAILMLTGCEYVPPLIAEPFSPTDFLAEAVRQVLAAFVL